MMWKKKKVLKCSMKRGKYFILNLTIHGFRFLYGVKKIFHSIVGSNGMAWVVRVWKEKQSFFIINLAKWQFLSLYGAWKEVKIFLFQLSKWTFAVQIVVKKEKINRWLPKWTVPFVLIMEKVLDFGYVSPLFQRDI